MGRRLRPAGDGGIEVSVARRCQLNGKRAPCPFGAAAPRGGRKHGTVVQPHKRLCQCLDIVHNDAVRRQDFERPSHIGKDDRQKPLRSGLHDGKSEPLVAGRMHEYIDVREDVLNPLPKPEEPNLSADAKSMGERHEISAQQAIANNEKLDARVGSECDRLKRSINPLPID